jgi:hypothetical protein
LVALTVAVLLGGSAASRPAAAGLDCRDISPTPTATGTPQPTPPWVPVDSKYVCNDAGVVANDLHVLLRHAANNTQPLALNPPGCGEPTFRFFGDEAPAYKIVNVVWSEPCVDPGERALVGFVADCTTPEPGCSMPEIECFYWTLEGTLAPRETFAVNPWECGTPLPTAPPVTPSPTPSPTPTPSPSPTATPTLSATQSSSVSATASPSLTPAALPQTGDAPGEGMAVGWLLISLGAALLTCASFWIARRVS